MVNFPFRLMKNRAIKAYTQNGDTALNLHTRWGSDQSDSRLDGFNVFGSRAGALNLKLFAPAGDQTPPIFGSPIP